MYVACVKIKGVTFLTRSKKKIVATWSSLIYERRYSDLLMDEFEHFAGLLISFSLIYRCSDEIVYLPSVNEVTGY